MEAAAAAPVSFSPTAAAKLALALNGALAEEASDEVLQLKAKVFAIAHSVEQEVQADSRLSFVIHRLMVNHKFSQVADITEYTRKARSVLGELIIAELDPYGKDRGSRLASLQRELCKIVSELEDFLYVYTTARNKLCMSMYRWSLDPSYCSWQKALINNCGYSSHEKCGHLKLDDVGKFALFVRPILMLDAQCKALMEGAQKNAQ